MIFHIHGGRGARNRLRQHRRRVRELWTDLTPQTRVLSALLLVFAIALTPNGQWLTWGVYGIVVGAIVLLSRVNGRDLAKRLAIEVLFVGLVLLGTLFRPGGTVLWQWGGLQITTEGVMVLGSVSIKLVLSLLVLNVLVLTTPISQLLQALLVLRVPRLLVAILAAMHRYIEVLVNEFQDMQRAAAARNLLSHPGWRRLVLGNMIGSLFIRTLDRGEQVHRAMVARGYSGLPPLPETSPYSRQDAHDQAPRQDAHDQDVHRHDNAESSNHHVNASGHGHGDRWVLIGLVAIAIIGQVFPFLVKGS